MHGYNKHAFPLPLLLGQRRLFTVGPSAFFSFHQSFSDNLASKAAYLIYNRNLCPNLPGNIQCCTEPPPQRDPFQPITFNIDSGVNDYTDFNDLPYDYYEETS